MHVSLVRSPKISSLSAAPTHGGVPPLGLAYLASTLRQAGHVCSIIDAYGEAPDQEHTLHDKGLKIVGLNAAQIVALIPPDCALIGVSIMFSQEWLYARQVILAIATARPNAVLVVGGEHATADFEHILRYCPWVRCCILGEGEETIRELAHCFETGADWHAVAGIAWLNPDGTVIRTAARQRVRALDDLPWPAWDLVPIENYLSRHLGYEERNQRTMPLLATRGCPYKCTFCSNPAMWGPNWLARNPQDVVDEILYYKSTYNADHFEFYDLTAVVDRKWMLRFSDLLIDQHVNVTWRMPSGTRSESLDASVVPKMHAAGCVGLVYAPESGSPATLKRIKKKVVPADMLASMRVARKSKLHIRAHFIVGLPGQTFREVLETFGFFAKLAWIGVDDVNVFPFFPYPGSELFTQLVQEGRIQVTGADYDAFLTRACFTDMRNISSWSDSFSPGTIRWLCILGPALFYSMQFSLRPYRLVRMGVRLVRKKPVTWLERFIFTTVQNFFSTRAPNQPHQSAV